MLQLLSYLDLFLNESLFLVTSYPHIQKWMTRLKDEVALNKGFTKACGNAKMEAMKVTKN